MHHALRLTKLGIYALIAAGMLSAQAAEGRWTEGFGQGNLEYFIEVQGMQLYIACPTQDGSADALSSVSLKSAASREEVPQFTIKVGGLSYDAPFAAGSRVGDNNFISLLDELRRGDAVISYPGKTLRFLKSNAAKVLPTVGKKGKGFVCNLG